MDGLSEDYNCFQPSHFVILDSQNSCPKSLNETSFLKSLPALQTPKAQSEHVGVSLSPNQKSAVSEAYQCDIDLIDSSNFPEVKSKFLETLEMESNQTATHSESSGEDSHRYVCNLSQLPFLKHSTFKETPSLTANVACEKPSSSKASTSETVQNVMESMGKPPESKNILTGKPEEIESKTLARKFLFKSGQDDSISDDRESEVEVNTPSRHIASLQVSPPMSVIVSDTADEMNYIEASPEHQSFPIIIPDSPTMENSDQDSCSQESTVMESTVIKKKESQQKSMEYSQIEGSKEDSENIQLHCTSIQPDSQVYPKECSQKDEICESQDLNLYLSFSSQISEIKTTQSEASKVAVTMKEQTSSESVHSVFKDSSSEDVLEFTLNLPKASPGNSLHNPSSSKTSQHRSGLRKTSISQTSQKDSSHAHSSISQTSQKKTSVGPPSVSQTSQKDRSHAHLSISQTSQKGTSFGYPSVSQTIQKESSLGIPSGDKQKKSYHDSMLQLSNSETSQPTSSSLNATNLHKTQQHQGDLPSQLNLPESFQEANPFDSQHFKNQRKNLLGSKHGENSQKEKQDNKSYPSASMSVSSVEGCSSKISNEEDLPKKTTLDSCPQETFTKIQDKKDTLSSDRNCSLIYQDVKQYFGQKRLSAGQFSSQGVMNIGAGDSNANSQEDEKEKQRSASLPDKLISSKSKPETQPNVEEVYKNKVKRMDDISQSPNSDEIVTTENNLPIKLARGSEENNNSNAKESKVEDDETNDFKMSSQMSIRNKSEKSLSVSLPGKIPGQLPCTIGTTTVSSWTSCPVIKSSKTMTLPGQSSCPMGESSRITTVPSRSSCIMSETSRAISEITHIEAPIMPTTEMENTTMMKSSLNILRKQYSSPLVARNNQVSRSQSLQQDDISIVQPVTAVTCNIVDNETQLILTQDVNIGACTSKDPYVFPDSQTKCKTTVVTTKKRQKLATKSIQKKNLKKLLPKKGTIFARNRGVRKDRKSPVYRVRFEAIRKRGRKPLTLNSNSAFLKVPSHKDIDSILSANIHNKGDKTPSSSDGGSQTKELQQQQCSLYTNLKKVLQRKITEETVVQIVYRKITVEMLRNSQVIDRRVIVEKNDPVVIKSSRNEEFKYLNSSKGLSSFCSPTSLTSGEYADVSSLSHSDSKASSHNSSSFSSLTVKSSLELPTPPSLNQSEKHHKKDIVNTLQKRQSVSSKSCQSHTPDEDMLKMLSPITLEDKQEHSANCSSGDDLQHQSWEQLGTPTITSTSNICNTSVTETVALSRYSSDDAACKSKTMIVVNSDSLFSSNENLNVSDQEITMEHRKNIPVTQPSGIVSTEIFPCNKNLNLPEISSKKSSVKMSENNKHTKTPVGGEKQALKRIHSSKPSKEEECSKKHKQDDTSKCSERAESPEITFQDQGKKTSQNIVKKDVHQQQAAIGVLIMAKWKDGFFYPGKLAATKKNSKYLVKFVDGDNLWVKINQILSVPYLPHGQNVMVQSDDGFFDSGMIINYKYNGSDSDEDVLYAVEMENSKVVQCTRKQVILSEDQAEDMLSNESFLLSSELLSTPRQSGADVSLDNLIDGSRRSVSRKVYSENTKSKKLRRMEPQAMSTPTHKRKAISSKKGVDSGICHIGAAIASPKHNYEETSRRAKKELFDVVKGPIPKLPLFNEMNFLLTYTEKTHEQKLLDKKLLHDVSSESSTNLSYSDLGVEPTVPFEKNHLRAQLEAGGGTVFNSWHKSFLSNHKRSFIVSNAYQRTVKYLQGLAAGIPCISHLWVRDCCKQGTLLDYRSYILQSGISITKRSLMESKMKSKCLENLAVMVTSSQDEFVNIWSEILTIAGCKIFKRFRKFKGSNKCLDVVITDGSCSHDIIEEAGSQHIPVVSTEWVIQCLIHGQKVTFDGHEKYAYNYEENI